MNGWEIEFNILLFIAAFAWVLFYLKKKKLSVFFGGLFLFAIISFVLALFIAPDNFGVLRLLCHALFAHGIILCIAYFIIARNHNKYFSVLCLFAALLISFAGLDAFLVEPHWLKISRTKIKSKKIIKPIKIVVLSDFQTDKISEYEKNVIDLALNEKPDLILMPGDYVQIENYAERMSLYHELNFLLKEKKFGEEIPVFAVQGNVDMDDWPEIFKETGVICLTSTTKTEKENFVLTGLGMEDSFNQNIKIQKENKFHIVFGHSPDFSLSYPPADLLIAGHTHGGQVCLPFFGPLLTLSQVPRKWAGGVTRMDENTLLIVSKGIGMERDNAPRLRFFCRPEIVVVTVIPE